MIILAMDCAGNACSVALLRDDAALAHDHRLMRRGQAEALMPMIDDLCRRAPCAPADLDAVAVTHGPGSFTGLRVSLAAARALALALQIPVLGLDVGECVAAAQPPDKTPLLVVLETGRADHFYADLYPQGCRGTAPAAHRGMVALDGAELCALIGGVPRPLRLAGDGAARARALLAQSGMSDTHTHPPDGAMAMPDIPMQALHVGQLARAQLLRHGPPTAPPRPLYLRRAVVAVAVP